MWPIKVVIPTGPDPEVAACLNPEMDLVWRSATDPKQMGGGDWASSIRVAEVGEPWNWRARWVVPVRQRSRSDVVSTAKVARCWDSQPRPFVHECGFRPGERTECSFECKPQPAHLAADPESLGIHSQLSPGRGGLPSRETTAGRHGNKSLPSARITGHSVWSHQPGPSRFHTGSLRAIRGTGSGDPRPGSRTARASLHSLDISPWSVRDLRPGSRTARTSTDGSSSGRFGTRRARAGGWPGRNGDGWRGCTRWSGCRCSHGRSGCRCWRGGTTGRGPCRPWWRGRSRRGRVRAAVHDRRPRAVSDPSAPSNPPDTRAVPAREAGPWNQPFLKA